MPRTAKSTTDSGEKSEITPSIPQPQTTQSHMCSKQALFPSKKHPDGGGSSRSSNSSGNTDADFACPGTGIPGWTGLGQCSKVIAGGGRSYHTLLDGCFGRPLGALCWLVDLWWSKSSRPMGSPVSPPLTPQV